MEQTQGTIEIEASPAEVLEVIADVESYPEWADVRSVKVLERDPKGRPANASFEVSAAGMTTTYTLAYTYAEADGGVSWVSEAAEGAVKAIEGGYDLEDAGAATRATYRLAVEMAIPLPGFLRRQAEKKIVRAALEGLKRRVESL